MKTLSTQTGLRSTSQLRADSSVDVDHWAGALRSCAASVFHTLPWAEYIEAELPGAERVCYTMLDAAGDVEAVALGFVQKSARNIAAPFTGRRWLDAVPAVRDGTADTALKMIRMIESHARRAGDVRFEVGSFASPRSPALLGSLEYSLRPRFEFELDLTRSEQALFDAMDIKRRQRIRKAKKSGVVVRQLPASEGIAHLRRLQRESFVRIVARGGPELDERNDLRGDPISILVDTGVGHIVGGFVGDACVSASLFTSFNGLVYYTLSGHDRMALESQAPSLVLWETILRFRSEGFARFNLGGCGAGAVEESSPEHGVYSYKKAFGGVRLECASGEKTLRPTVQRVTNLLRKVMA